MDPDPLTFDQIWEAKGDQPEDYNCEQFVADLFALLDVGPVELSLLVTDDTRMRELNHSYRGRDATTDVLSFPAQDLSPPPDQARHLGDVVISYEQALRQASELGQSLAVELRFLLLHGVLHLLGYDHEADNGEMLAYQRELKDKLPHWFEGIKEGS